MWQAHTIGFLGGFVTGCGVVRLWAHGANLDYALLAVAGLVLMWIGVTL